MRATSLQTPRAFILVAFFCALLGVGCSHSPRSTLETMQQASRNGNPDELLACVTERSRPLVSVAIQLGSGGGPLAFVANDSELEVISEHLRPGTSMLVVEEGGISHVLPFVEEEGQWKVDLFLLNGFLEGDRFPGFGRPRTPP